MFTEINGGFLRKVLSSVPADVTPEIRTLCAEIVTGCLPEFVKLRPDHAAEVRECFHNVTRVAERNGGGLVYGWALWEWPRIFIEAEHHAIWRSPSGELVDVTPHEYPADRVLFLEDPSATYDFETAVRRPNQKRALRDVAAIHLWIEATDQLHEKLEACSVGKEYRFSGADQAELVRLGQLIEARKIGVILGLANELGPNQPCLCRSGRKFKKCCSGLFR